MPRLTRRESSCGDGAARGACDEEPATLESRDLARREPWAWRRTARTRVALALAELVVERTSPGDARVAGERLLAAVRVWLGCPCPQHLAAGEFALATLPHDAIERGRHEVDAPDAALLAHRSTLPGERAAFDVPRTLGELLRIARRRGASDEDVGRALAAVAMWALRA